MEPVAADERLPRYVRSILGVPRKIWRAIEVVFCTIEVFGGMTIMAFIIAGASQRPNGDKSNESAEKDATIPEEHRTDRPARGFLHALVVNTKEVLFRPTSGYIPMSSAIIALIYFFRAMDTYQITPAGIEAYHVSCPEMPRRTQNETFVKLFAIYAMTMGLHSYHYYLVGGTSWTYKIFFAMELLLCPLASVLHFAMEVWYGFSDLLLGFPGPWVDSIPLRYRFARMCHCRVAAGAPSTYGSDRQLTFVNPRHLKAVPLRRDLKWVGRATILIIFLGWYAQAAVVLTRRFLSNTGEAIDISMMFLILSGQVALIRSTTMLLLNLSWLIEPETAPCVEKTCGLPQCEDLRAGQGQETPRKIIMFGWDVTHVPRSTYYEIAGGYVEVAILAHSQNSPWSILVNLLGLDFAWRFSFAYPIAIQSVWNLIHGDDEHTAAATTEKSTSPQPDSTQPDPVSQDDPKSRSEEPYISNIWDLVIHGGAFILGAGGMVAFCLVMFLQLGYQFGPAILFYIQIAEEMIAWKDPVATVPCPQLWKDNLAGGLWSL